MGVETPLTIHAAADSAPALPPRPGHRCWRPASATGSTRDRVPRDRATTTRSTASRPCIIDPVDPTEVAPYYLLDGARLARPVVPGQLIGLDDVEGVDAPALAAYRAGIARTMTRASTTTITTRSETIDDDPRPRTHLHAHTAPARKEHTA